GATYYWKINPVNDQGENTSCPEFMFQMAGPIAVTGFTPTSACGEDGGTEVVITGTNFQNVTDVTFNGISAASYTVDSATQITAVLPAGDTGGQVVVYSTPSSNGSAAGPADFVINANPVVVPITPEEPVSLCIGDTTTYSNP